MADDTKYPNGFDCVTGVSSFFKILERHKKDTGQKLEDGMLKYAMVVMKKGDYYCPKDTLDLVNSGHIIVEGKGLNVKFRVTYGGEDAPYALWVHEDLEKYHEPPTCAKWLERAIRETRGTGKSIVQRELQGGVRLTKDGEEVE
jgi:hypothetical protein